MKSILQPGYNNVIIGQGHVWDLTNIVIFVKKWSLVVIKYALLCISNVVFVIRWSLLSGGLWEVIILSNNNLL